MRHQDTEMCVGERNGESDGGGKSNQSHAQRWPSRPMEMVTVLKHVGKVLSQSEDDWTEVVVNLWKARRKWENFFNVLGR